jgi:chromate transport protein ChrA
MVATSEQQKPRAERSRANRLPVWRIGITGGLVGILCCVGPTALAVLGVISAGTAFAWATDLYDGYAWLFRVAGLAVLALLVWRFLRRRNQCSVAGVRHWRCRLFGVLGIAVLTYIGLYALTTWLGTFA